MRKNTCVKEYMGKEERSGGKVFYPQPHANQSYERVLFSENS